MGHPYSRVRSQKTLYLWRRIGLTQDVKEYAKITPQSVNGRHVPLSDCPTISLGKGHLLVAMRQSQFAPLRNTRENHPRHIT